jgi:hypothetical protein
MAWQLVRDPQTGEEKMVEVAETPTPETTVPQALQPAGIGPEGPIRALEQDRAAQAREDASLTLPALQEMPPVRDPSTLAVRQAENRPDYLARFGGPKRIDLAGKGFLGTLGEFATSDLGRNLIGALGVGLAGIRNPRDNGALQQQLMQMHFQGVRERAAKAEQGEAMGGLFTALNSAHAALAKGDLDAASNILAPLAKNPAVLRNPAAMQALLSMQNQLTNRAGVRASLQRLSKGPLTTESVLAEAAQMGDTGLMKDLAPLLPTKEKDFYFHDAKNGVVGKLGMDGKLRTYNYETGLGGKEPLTIENIKPFMKTLVGLGVTDLGEFVGLVNKGDIRAKALFGAAVLATPVAGEGLGSETERSAEAIRKEQEYIARGEPVPAEVKAAADRARVIQSRKAEIAEAGGYAGTRGRREADLDRRPGEVNRHFFDRVTMEPRTEKTVRELQADPTAVEVEPNQAMNISQTSSGLTIATELADIIRNNRDLFPEKKTDVTWRTALAAFAPGVTGRFDPRVARMQTLSLAIPNLVRALGDTANIAVAERAMTQTGLGLRPMTREAAEASLRTLVKILNASLRKRGFEGVNVEELLRADQPSSGGSLSPEDLGKLKEILGVK